MFKFSKNPFCKEINSSFTANVLFFHVTSRLTDKKSTPIMIRKAASREKPINPTEGGSVFVSECISASCILWHKVQTFICGRRCCHGSGFSHHQNTWRFTMVSADLRVLSLSINSEGECEERGRERGRDGEKWQMEVVNDPLWPLLSAQSAHSDLAGWITQMYMVVSVRTYRTTHVPAAVNVTYMKRVFISYIHSFYL